MSNHAEIDTDADGARLFDAETYEPGLLRSIYMNLVDLELDEDDVQYLMYEVLDCLYPDEDECPMCGEVHDEVS